MRRTLRALRNYLAHSHEDRVFRWARLLAHVLAILAAGCIAFAHKPAEVVTVDMARCHPFAKGFEICPRPSPRATETPKTPENP